MTKQEAAKLVQDTADQLGEYFDGVVILATWEDGTYSQQTNGGAGSWFTQKGLIDEQYERCRFRREAAEFQKSQDAE